MQHFPQVPHPLFLLVVLFAGFRWMCFYSPYVTYQIVQHKGKTVEEQTGLTLWQQYWRVLAVSIGHGLAPKAWYQFRLYHSDQGQSLWDNVYDQETSAFHRYRNQDRPHYREHVSLLGDKQHFEAYLHAQGISAAGTLTLIARGDSNFRHHLEVLISQQGRLFCKRRTGNQGKGAFSIWRQEGCLHIQPRGKEQLPETERDAFLQGNIKAHDYLIQPEYRHHQRLQAAQQGRESPAMTLRIISHCSLDKIVQLEFAVMHWPVMDGQQTRFHYPLAIDADSGTLDEHYPEWSRDNLEQEQLAILKRFVETLSGETLPFWSEAVQLVKSAHPLLAGVDQIAWDFILAEERAVLLEGNSGWGGLAVCQWFGYDVKRYME